MSENEIELVAQQARAMKREIRRLLKENAWLRSRLLVYESRDKRRARRIHEEMPDFYILRLLGIEAPSYSIIGDADLRNLITVKREQLRLKRVIQKQ